MVKVEIKQLENASGLNIPHYATELSAGMDLESAEDVVLKSGEYKLVKTGLSIALPAQYEAQIRPRSGLAFKHGITVLNSPGTIDADYRGEIGVLLINHGNEDFTITRGMRIAQMVIAQHAKVELVAVNNLDETQRGQGGFGSTGFKEKLQA